MSLQPKGGMNKQAVTEVALERRCKCAIISHRLFGLTDTGGFGRQMYVCYFITQVSGLET